MEFPSKTCKRYTCTVLVVLILHSLPLTETFPKRKDACGPQGVCMCSGYRYTYLVDCSKINLTDIPQSIPNSTKQLDLSDNMIVDVEKNTFSNLWQLRHLDLTRNMVQNLPKDIFRNLSNLDVLHLIENRIQILDKAIFSDLCKLQLLNMQFNMIQKLHKDIFRNLSSLRSLYMYENKIQTFHKDTFRNLSSLEQLYLSRNMIYKLHRNTFWNLSRLELLELSVNMIQILDKDIFRNLHRLKTLDISHNRLKFLSPNLLSHSNIAHVLNTLLLHRNQLVYLPANVFHGLLNLTILSLFHNNIQALDKDSFAGTGCESIYLFGNHLSVLSNASFNNENITDIHLYGNNITHINKTAMIGVSATTDVYLDCHHIHELQPNIKITCVTPTFVPTFLVKTWKLVVTLLREGFECKETDPTYHCSPCPRGTYGNTGKCVRFPRGGFYQDNIGVSSFHENSKQCPNGTYVKDGKGLSIFDCVDCPDGTNKTIFAGYRACFCLENYSRTDRFGPCQLCLEKGVNCSEKDYNTIQPGFYWNWNFLGANITSYKNFVKNLNIENETFDSSTEYNGEIPQAFPCPRPTNCYNSQGDLEVQCSEGYTGWLCSKCKENFYSVLNYCMPCPESAWLYTEFAVIIIFCVIINIFFYRLYKKEKNRKDRIFLNIIISRGKIVIGFYQVVGEFFASIHDVNWAKALHFIGDFVSFIELNVFRMIVRPKCFHEKLQLNPKIEYLIGMAFPCTLIFSSLILYWIVIARYKFKTRFTRATESLGNNASKLKSRLLASVIVLMFVTYPPICTTVFQLYPRACETFCLNLKKSSCKTLLRSDYNIQCKDLENYHVSAYISTAVYVVGFPVVLLLILRNKAKCILSQGLSVPPFAVNEEREDDLQNLTDDTSSSKENLIWMDFLCENYKPQFWYWEIIELTRKVTQTVLITLLGWENRFTVLLTIGISVLYLTLHARYMPMKSTFEQRLQMFSLTAILANVLVAAMDVPEEYGDEMLAAIIILNVLVIVIVAAEVLLGLFIRLRHVAVHKKISRFVISCIHRVCYIYRKISDNDEGCNET